MHIYLENTTLGRFLKNYRIG